MRKSKKNKPSEKLPEDLTISELSAMATRLGCELKIYFEPRPKQVVTVSK